MIAAEQRIALINTPFTEDLPILNTRAGLAGAGNSGWAGMVNPDRNLRYPGFYALRQLVVHLDGYRSVERLPVDGPEGVRVYEFRGPASRWWVAWFDPPRVTLAGEPVPRTEVTIRTASGRVIVEPMISAMRQTSARTSTLQAPLGAARVELTPTPVFVRSG